MIISSLRKKYISSKKFLIGNSKVILTRGGNAGWASLHSFSPVDWPDFFLILKIKLSMFNTLARVAG